ncbi:hypothetical protein [Muribaculum sp.]|uniref:hypothetical protein n=1 Tax=Muribaculum sp. TaxID=1918611 RepID=UPI0023C3AE9B|nr:hypothetical protein [Muribaculum sp.]MDE5704623.1 hypothetical protein [Muribaculum sp.]MDE5922531.1 hypothetical protein [Muribaculum sp.]
MASSPLEHLTELMRDPSLPVSVEWVDEMARLYPYMTLPAKLLLERAGDTLDEPTRRRVMQQMALNSSSHEMLYRIANPENASDAGFYPPEQQPEALDTDSAIETFMSHYGRPDPQESALLERLIFNPVPDYALTLADEEERSLPTDEEAYGDSPDSLINAFILKSRRDGGHFPSSTECNDAAADSSMAKKAEQPRDAEPLRSPNNASEQGLLSESLAKFFIKQRRYAKAYEIISNLSLKFPEKSRYFADQLRFLQKLIINEQFQKQK